MHAVYLDTEFTRLDLKRQLISLALVDAHGSELYVELTDGWSPESCSEFTRHTVLPQLRSQRHGMSTEEARTAVRRFLAGLGEVVIVGDAMSWDWPMLLQLVGPARLPANVKGLREARVPILHGARGAVPHHALLDARMLRDANEDATAQAA